LNCLIEHGSDVNCRKSVVNAKQCWRSKVSFKMWPPGIQSIGPSKLSILVSVTQLQFRLLGINIPPSQIASFTWNFFAEKSKNSCFIDFRKKFLIYFYRLGNERWMQASPDRGCEPDGKNRYHVTIFCMWTWPKWNLVFHHQH